MPTLLGLVGLEFGEERFHGPSLEPLLDGGGPRPFVHGGYQFWRIKDAFDIAREGDPNADIAPPSVFNPNNLLPQDMKGQGTLVRYVSDGSWWAGVAMGSGYPADPATMEYLRGYVLEHKDLPPHTRRSWETARRLMEDFTMKKPTLDVFR